MDGDAFILLCSGNKPRPGVWGAELCLETVEHLPKPQGRLHWESYDLILFQQGSRPGQEETGF